MRRYRFEFTGGYLEVSENGLVDTIVRLQKLFGYIPNYKAYEMIED